MADKFNVFKCLNAAYCAGEGLRGLPSRFNAGAKHYNITLHWNMDVNFQEDASLASTVHATENLAILKRLAGTLVRIDLGCVRETAQRRRQARWDDSCALRLLSKIFEVKL